MSDAAPESILTSPAHALRRGVLTLALLAGATLAVVSAMLPVRAAARVGPAEPLEGVSDSQRAQRTARFEAGLRAAKERTTGRSPFYPIPPKVEDVPVPVRYNGPALIAMVNGEAWFADGRRLRVGAPADDGLAVLELHEPWYAKLGWQGAEFSVGLFERSPVSLTDAALEPTPGVEIVPPTPLPQDPPGSRPGASERSGDRPPRPRGGDSPPSPSSPPGSAPAGSPASGPSATPAGPAGAAPSAPAGSPAAAPEPAPAAPDVPPAEPPPPPPNAAP